MKVHVNKHRATLLLSFQYRLSLRAQYRLEKKIAILTRRDKNRVIYTNNVHLRTNEASERGIFPSCNGVFSCMTRRKKKRIRTPDTAVVREKVKKTKTWIITR